MYHPTTKYSSLENLIKLLEATYPDATIKVDLIKASIEHAINTTGLKPKTVNEKSLKELGVTDPTEIKGNTYIYLTNPESGLDYVLFYNRLIPKQPDSFLHELWNPNTNRMEDSGAITDTINVREEDYNELSIQTILSTRLKKHYQIIGEYPKEFTFDLGTDVVGSISTTEVLLTVEEDSLVYVPDVYVFEQKWTKI